MTKFAPRGFAAAATLALSAVLLLALAFPASGFAAEEPSEPPVEPPALAFSPVAFPATTLVFGYLSRRCYKLAKG